MLADECWSPVICAAEGSQVEGLPQPALESYLYFIPGPWNAWSMGDDLLASTDIEDVLSEVYVSAIAARAGYTFSKPNLDRDSVDLTISAGGKSRPKLDIQLKGTMNLDVSSDPMAYSLKLKNYNDLREPTQTPRILVVVRLPRDRDLWLSVSPDEMILRHCAYWVSLRDAPETDVQTAKTVYIPAKNRFDIDGLKALMDQSRTGIVK